MTTWVEPTLRPDLSQGDVVDDLIFVRLTRPLRWLGKKDADKGVSRWLEVADPMPHGNGETHVLSVGTIARGMVLSHDCEIDKGGDRKRVLVAAMRPWGSLPVATQAAVSARRMYALWPMSLPDGEWCVDLRTTGSFERRSIDSATRRFSLSDTAREHLQSQLLVFYAERLPHHPVRLSAACLACDSVVIDGANVFDGRGLIALEAHRSECASPQETPGGDVMRAFRWVVEQIP